MNKNLSERDVITKFIIPSLEKSGWDKHFQIREEVGFTKGRVLVKGKMVKRANQKRADIILYYDNDQKHPVAVIEAKDGRHNLGDGMSQALEYAGILDIPVAIASNGTGFSVQYRNGCGRDSGNGIPVAIEDIGLDEFPPPFELWECYKCYNKLFSQEE